MTRTILSKLMLLFCLPLLVACSLLGKNEDKPEKNKLKDVQPSIVDKIPENPLPLKIFLGSDWGNNVTKYDIKSIHLSKQDFENLFLPIEKLANDQQFFYERGDYQLLLGELHKPENWNFFKFFTKNKVSVIAFIFEANFKYIYFRALDESNKPIGDIIQYYTDYDQRNGSGGNDIEIIINDDVIEVISHSWTMEHTNGKYRQKYGVLTNKAKCIIQKSGFKK